MHKVKFMTQKVPFKKGQKVNLDDARKQQS